MGKWATFGLGLLLALGLASPAHAGGNSTGRRYVAQGDNFVVQAFLSGWTGVAMNGGMSFVPSTDHAAIKIEDRVATGTIPVFISTADGARRGCVAAGATTRITNLVPGRRVWLYVLDGAHRGNCDEGATTGLLTIA